MKQIAEDSVRYEAGALRFFPFFNASPPGPLPLDECPFASLEMADAR